MTEQPMHAPDTDDSDYEVRPDGEYPQEVTREVYPLVDPDALILGE